MYAVAEDRTKLFHDLLVSFTPEGVKHSCDLCTQATEATSMADTLTEDEVKAQIDKAVADALGPAQARIKELEDKLNASEADDAVTQAVTEATTPLNDKVTELTAALDAAELARGAAETERTALVDWLSAEAEMVAAAERRTARIQAVKDIGLWPEDTFDETKQANKDRIDKWAAKSDEDFEDLVEGWKAGVPAKADQANGKLPSGRSAMQDVATGDVSSAAKSPIKRMIESTIPSLAPAQASS